MKDKIELVRKSSQHQSKLKDISIRLLRLEKLQKSIERNEHAIKQALLEDLGKCSFESYLSEIGFVIDDLKRVQRKLKGWVRPQKIKSTLSVAPGGSWVIPEPYGVVLIIAPWNYPFQLCFSPLLGAISAGNHVVIKPSEFSVRTSLVIEKIIRETFSEDEVLVIQGGVAETEELLNEKYDYIFFTGSTDVGKIIYKKAAEHMTPVTLELGGKSPCLVDQTAKLEIAAKRIVWGKFLNAGQTCVAPDFLLLHEDIASEMVDHLKGQIENFYGKNPKDSRDFGRIISDKHHARLVKLMQGHEVLVGGEYVSSEKFIAPTLLRLNGWESPIMQEEVFGPLLPILVYKNFSDIIGDLKKRARPLAAYLFSEDKKNIQSFLGDFSFGGGCVNDTLLHLANPNLPFGGVGESGIGAYHGQHSFDLFSHKKSVLKQKTLFDLPFRYPPYKNKEGLVRKLLG